MNFLSLSIILLCAYWIFKFLIELMYKSKVETKTETTHEASIDGFRIVENLHKENLAGQSRIKTVVVINDFIDHKPLASVYFKLKNSELEYYSYCIDTDTLIRSSNMVLKYGNTTYEQVAKVNLNKAGIVRQFLNERENGFHQYEEVSESDFMHTFIEVANMSAKSFEPILNNQFHG
jgi:hypothetical protein